MLIIHHSNCHDGLTAAWVLSEHYPGATVVPALHGDAPPDVTDQDVIIVDFSYPRDVLERLHAAAKSLIVLDHHKTAQRILEGLPYCTFDMNRSGARLAWDYAHPGVEPPPVVRYVEDRDLWRDSALPEFDRVIAWIYSHDARNINNVGYTNRELLMNFPSVVDRGRVILRVKERNIADVSRQAHFVTLGGVRTLVVNNGLLTLNSDVGHELIERDGVELAGCWALAADGIVRWSLRSVDAKASASDAAEVYGGGGHRNAAGFTVPWAKHCEIMATAEWVTR